MEVVNVKNSKYEEYIGRGSILGNPFVIGKDGDREEVIKKYKNYIWNCLKVTRELEMLTAVEFEDCVLGCHCKPKECHGDIVISAVNYLREEKE